MDLTRAESVLIDFIRGEAGSDFVINVVARDGGWFVTMASPSDPVLVGGGLSFDAAMTAAVASGSDDPGGGEETPARVGLRLVVGTGDPAQAKAAA